MSHQLEGIIESGFGLAVGSLAPMHAVIEERSGLALVEGTLNVRLEKPYIVIPDIVLAASEHGHHETLLLQRCRLFDAPGLIVRTSTQAAGESHPLDVIEVLATENVREAHALTDGDSIVIEVPRSL